MEENTKTCCGTLKLKKGEYLPCTGQVYPQDNPFERLVPSVQLREINFDETYPYLDNSLSFKIQHKLCYFLVFCPYFLVNKLVYGVRFEGRDILGKYKKEFGKGFDESNLRYMRLFFKAFPICDTLRHELTWSHYTELLPIKDVNKLYYYLNITIDQRIDVRTLRNKIKSNEYDRLPIETRNKLLNKEKLEVKDLVPNPILIRNKNNIDIVNEKILSIIGIGKKEFLKCPDQCKNCEYNEEISEPSCLECNNELDYYDCNLPPIEELDEVQERKEQGRAKGSQWT